MSASRRRASQGPEPAKNPAPLVAPAVPATGAQRGAQSGTNRAELAPIFSSLPFLLEQMMYKQENSCYASILISIQARHPQRDRFPAEGRYARAAPFDRPRPAWRAAGVSRGDGRFFEDAPAKGTAGKTRRGTDVSRKLQDLAPKVLKRLSCSTKVSVSNPTVGADVSEVAKRSCKPLKSFVTCVRLALLQDLAPQFPSPLTRA